MLYGHREIKHCSYSCLLTREAVGAGVALNAAIMLVHHSNSCLEEKHRGKKKTIWDTALLQLGWSFSPGISLWFSGSQNSRIQIFFSRAPTHEKPLVKLSNELLWFGSMAFMCVFFLSSSSYQPPFGKLIYPDFFLTVGIETEICHPPSENPTQTHWERPIFFKKFKKSHFPLYIIFLLRK